MIKIILIKFCYKNPLFRPTDPDPEYIELFINPEKIISVEKNTPGYPENEFVKINMDSLNDLGKPLFYEVPKYQFDEFLKNMRLSNERNGG